MADRYFKRNGSESVEKLSDSRTASPNLWWSAEQMTEHGFTECQPDAEAIKISAEEAFNVETFQEGLFGAAIQNHFSSDSVLNEFDKICAFLTGTKKIALLKQYLQWRISKEVITPGDYAVVAGLLLNQNINLEVY